MPKKSFLKMGIILTGVVFILTACNLTNMFRGNQVDDFEHIETAAAATITAKLTQSAFETMVAQLTGIPPSNTPGPDDTPSPTSTAAPGSTNTPVPTNLPPTATYKPSTATAIPIPCSAAKFIEDVTIPDWITVDAGQRIDKSWKIKNVGSCTWNTKYTIFFFGGNQLSAPASVAFPNSVKPGETVNLTVPMTAPSDKGSFTGSWMFKSDNGTVFGTGSNFNAPLTVNIKVASLPKSKDPNTRFDMVVEMCSAAWRTNAGNISCPSGGVDTVNGSITRSFAPILAGGFQEDEGTLFTVPAKGGDGMILGRYPKFKILEGDRFRALLVCANNAKKCSVKYELLYMVDGDSKSESLGTWDITYPNSTQVDVNLDALAGKDVILMLKVYSNGDPTDDVALWVAARVTNP